VDFDNLTVSYLDNPLPAHPLLSTASPSGAPPLAGPKDDSSVNTSGSTQLLAQFQAQLQALTSPSPPTDDISLGTSMSTKALLCQLQLQPVKSLSAAGTQQPQVDGTPQTPTMGVPLGSMPVDLGTRV